MMKQAIGSLLAAAVVCASASFASISDVDSEAAAKQLEERLQSTSERLNLTEEQKPLVEAILRDSAEKRAAIFESYGVEPGTKPNLGIRKLRKLRGEMTALSEATTEQLSDVLSAEQMAEYAKIQEEQAAAMRERRNSQ